MQTCPRCDHDNDDNEPFCVDCNAYLKFDDAPPVPSARDHDRASPSEPSAGAAPPAPPGPEPVADEPAPEPPKSEPERPEPEPEPPAPRSLPIATGHGAPTSQARSIAKASSDECRTALAAVHKVIEGARAHGRDDLAARLRSAEHRIAATDLATVVIGEFQKGKSSLINELCGFDVCPVDAVDATARATAVRYGADLRATVALGATSNGNDAATASVEIAHLDRYALERGELHDRVDRIDVACPSPLLEAGLLLVDTPGTGGLDSEASQVALATLALAEAAIFVTDATQELTATELDYLKKAFEQCGRTIVVMTKIDLFADWRRIAELNRGHLRRHRIDVPVLAVSSTLHRLGRLRGDHSLVEESGIVELRELLVRHVAQVADRVAARAAAREVLFVLDQLALQLRSQLEAIAGPEEAKAATAKLQEAQQRAARLRQSSAGWQTTLADGLQDLSAGVEQDIVRRIKLITREGELAIEQNDPAEIWAEFEPWIRQRVIEIGTANDRELRNRVEETVKRVAVHFADADLSGQSGVDLVALAELDLTKDSPVDHVMADTRLEGLRSKALMNIVTAGRSGLAGTGLIAGVAHLAGLVAGPLGLAIAGIGTTVVAAASAGVARKVFADLRRSELAGRRQKAITAFRRYMDDAANVLVNDTRTSIRTAQRMLRDRMADLASELERSAAHAQAAAQLTCDATEQQRKELGPELRAHLDRIAFVRDRVQRLANLDLGTDAALVATSA